MSASAEMGVLLIEPNGTGGVWEYTCELAEALCSVARVALLTSQDYETGWLTGRVPVVSSIRWERAQGGRVDGAADLFRKGRNAMRYALGVRVALSKHLSTDYPLVHFQGTYWPPAVLWTAVLCSIRGRKFIYTPHNSFSRSVSVSGRALWLVCQWAIMRVADAVLVHTPFDRDRLVARGIAPSKKVVVIQYGASQPQDWWPGREEARRRLGLAPRAKYIALLGNLRRDKGLEHVLQALPAVTKRVPDARLLVAGSDSEGIGGRAIGDLASEVRKMVEFRPGYFPNEDLPAYFSSADVVCLPYLQASDSAVGHRAQVQGCKIVAYDVGGLRQSLGSGAHTTWVEPGDIAALGETLVKVLSGPEAPEAHADPEHEPATWADVSSHTFEVYQRVLQGRSAVPVSSLD